MGTKSYVKPTRVHSHLLAGLCVNINEIQSPRPKEDAKVGKVVAIRNHYHEELEKLEKIANKLSQEDLKRLELLKGDNNFYDDHSLSQEDLEKIEKLCNSCDDSHDDH